MEEWYAKLEEWYVKNCRELPWRTVKNGYYTWISEVILQQTRVAQGLPYFYRFIEKFPSVQDLAAASEEEVLLVWQGLGYYSRARNLHKGATQITEHLNGDFNQKPETLLSVKGIGHYTANAIASIAYNYPVPVVDGNVYRVIARFWGIGEPVPGEKARKLFTELLQPVVEKTTPSLFNQALMELGALVCVPVKPKCEECPLLAGCFAYANGKTEVFPVKVKKKKPLEVYTAYLHFEFDGNKFLLKKRNEGLWIGLYEFPAFESSAKLSREEVLSRLEEEGCSSGGLVESVSRVFSCKHQLSHRTVFADFWKIKTRKKPVCQNLATFELELEQLSLFPVHRLMKKYVDTLLRNKENRDLEDE